MEHPAGNPKPIAEVTGVGKGTYTQITAIAAPDSAQAGQTVNVEVKIKNNWTGYVHIYCVAVRDTVDRFIDWIDAWVAPGATQSYYGSFVMPNQSCTINAYSYYEGADGYLYSDDSKSKDVALAEVYEGTISRKELEYNESRANIPAYNIPQGKRGLVHIWGRNDTDKTQQMGIWWEVKDPDGVVRETYSAWEAWPYTSPGSAHEFIGGRFDLDKPGTWRISVQLFMKIDGQSPLLDEYAGTLCTVQAQVPEPEFAGFAVTDYSKK